MMKKLFHVFSSIFFVIIFSSCALRNEDALYDKSIGISVPKDASVFSIMGLEKVSDERKTDHRYSIVYSSSYSEVMANLASKKMDVAFLPVDLASVLYNKTKGDIKIYAISTLNNIYLITNNKTYNLSKINTVYILKNELHLKPIVQLILGEIGIENFDFKILDDKYDLNNDLDNTEDETGTAFVISQPYCEKLLDKYKFKNIRITNFWEMWEKIDDRMPIPTSCIAVRKDFIGHSEKDFKKFIEGYMKNQNYANENLHEASSFAKYTLNIDKEILTKTIPKCNLVNITGSSMKEIVDNFLKKINKLSPELIGGKLPDKNFYVTS